MGVRAATPPNLWRRERDPNLQDYSLYVIGDLWWNRSTRVFWILEYTDDLGAHWVILNTGTALGILSINGILPDGVGNFGLVAGPNIILTPGVNSLTIESTGGGIGIQGWTEIAVNTAAAVNQGYVVNAGAPITVTLPAVFAFGDEIEIHDKGLNGFIVQAAGGDTIVWNGEISSAGGGWNSNTAGCHVRLLGVTANSRWDIIEGNGNLSSF